MDDDTDPQPGDSPAQESKSKRLCLSLNGTGNPSNSLELTQAPIGNGKFWSTMHPLLDIDLVLKVVFSYLPQRSFKAASLVCKTWSNAIRKLMIKYMSFKFTEEMALKLLKDTHEQLHERFLRNDLIDSSICLKLSLMSCHAGKCKNSPENIDTISFATALALIERIVKMDIQIVELRLDFCTTSSISEAWEIIRFLSDTVQRFNIYANCDDCQTTSDVSAHAEENQEVTDRENPFNKDNLLFPNLKVISGFLRETKCDRSDIVLRLIRELLLRSPNLEDLHCDLPSCRHEMFEVFTEKPSALQHLKALSHVYLNGIELQVLISKNLKLKSLSMVLHSGFRVPAFSQFISSQGRTLETLEVDFLSLPNVPEKFLCGIDLVNLRHLSMRKFFGSIHFVSYMENLESLTLKDINLSVALHDEAATHQYKSTLKSLKIFGGTGSTGRFLLPSVYNDIVKFFPELRQLRMEYFTDSTLKIIVEGLPHLEELDIPNGVYSDVRMGNGVADRREEQNENVFRDTGMDSVEQKPMCLADLKKLQKVVLQSPRITDNGICFGLARCRELRSVSIDSPLVTDVGLNVLCERPDILHLEYINCYQLTTSGISEAKQLCGSGRTLIIKNM